VKGEKSWDMNEINADKLNATLCTTNDECVIRRMLLNDDASAIRYAERRSGFFLKKKRDGKEKKNDGREE